MFIPIFIAILMGLISPDNYSANCHNGGTVQANNSGPEDPSTGENPGNNPGGDGTGISGPGAGGPGGNTGQNPPPKP